MFEAMIENGLYVGKNINFNLHYVLFIIHPFSIGDFINAEHISFF